MGLLDKVKGILFDEEEVEIPEIKKESKKEIKRNIVEEKNPIKELKVPKDDLSDKENYKSESTFTFPIDFEDEEEPVKEVIKEPVRTRYEEKKYIEKKKDTRDYSDFLNKKNEDKKQFKPTPIISPVYGVLDQNYKKDDVIVKKDVLRRPSEISLEEVRKRAFGSLEDELEQNLTGDSEIEKTKEVEVVKTKEVTVEKPVDKKKTIGELIMEDDSNLEIPEIDSIRNDSIVNTNIETTEILEEPKNSIDDLLNRDDDILDKEIKDDNNDEIDDDEADLFSLIDSMYEEKGE